MKEIILRLVAAVFLFVHLIAAQPDDDDEYSYLFPPTPAPSVESTPLDLTKPPGSVTVPPAGNNNQEDDNRDDTGDFFDSDPFVSRPVPTAAVQAPAFSISPSTTSPTFAPVSTLTRPPSVRIPTSSSSSSNSSNSNTTNIWESNTQLNRPTNSAPTNRSDAPFEFGEFVDMNEPVEGSEEDGIDDDMLIEKSPAGTTFHIIVWDGDDDGDDRRRIEEQDVIEAESKSLRG